MLAFVFIELFGDLSLLEPFGHKGCFVLVVFYGIKLFNNSVKRGFL